MKLASLHVASKASKCAQTWCGRLAVASSFHNFNQVVQDVKARLPRRMAGGGTEHTLSSGSATIVILFFLLGVSAKHLSEDVSTTVSQKDTTGSATLTSMSAYCSLKSCRPIIPVSELVRSVLALLPCLEAVSEQDSQAKQHQPHVNTLCEFVCI